MLVFGTNHTNVYSDGLLWFDMADNRDTTSDRSVVNVIGPVLFAIAAVGFFYLSVTEVSGSADLTDTGPLLFFVAGCLFLVVLLMTALSRG